MCGIAEGGALHNYYSRYGGFMKTKIDLKKKCLMFLIVTCLVFVTSCSFLTKQNPNVKTPLDAAKITYAASTEWYLGVYNDVVLLNNATYLNDEAVIVLRNKLNPAMDNYKHVLIDYGDVIEQVESSGGMSSISKKALTLKAAELNIIKQSIIGLLLTMEQIRIDGGN